MGSNNSSQMKDTDKPTLQQGVDPLLNFGLDNRYSQHNVHQPPFSTQDGHFLGYAPYEQPTNIFGDPIYQDSLKNREHCSYSYLVSSDEHETPMHIEFIQCKPNNPNQMYKFKVPVHHKPPNHRCGINCEHCIPPSETADGIDDLPSIFMRGGKGGRSNPNNRAEYTNFDDLDFNTSDISNALHEESDSFFSTTSESPDMARLRMELGMDNNVDSEDDYVNDSEDLSSLNGINSENNEDNEYDQAARNDRQVLEKLGFEYRGDNEDAIHKTINNQVFKIFESETETEDYPRHDTKNYNTNTRHDQYDDDDSDITEEVRQAMYQMNKHNKHHKRRGHNNNNREDQIYSSEDSKIFDTGTETERFFKRPVRINNKYR